MLEPQNDHFVRDFLQFSHFVASKSTFSYPFSHEPQNLRPQNRCFARSFRQFSAHLSKCHARHPICTSSPLHEALTMRFAKNTQHDTSKVLQPPRKMTMEVKVLRKTQLIFLKRRKSIAPATQNDFQHVMKPCWTVTKCHACHSKPTRHLRPPKVTTFAELAMGTAIRASRDRPWTVAVAKGCATSSEHTSTPRPPE